MSFEFTENVSLCFPDINKNLKESFIESEGNFANNKLVIELAAIHAGLTANYNNYTEAELTNSLKSWVEPYPKPIILNHDPESDPKGRVMAARMDKEAEDGTPYARLQIAVLDPEAIARVVDGRYITGSVGGKAESATCSICNADWAKPSETIPCKHRRGNVYNGKLAFFNLGGLNWKEYSFVNMPADQKSGIRPPSSSSTEDSDWIKSARLYSINMNEESILELNESENPINILDNMKKKDAHYTYMNIKGTFLTATAYDYQENRNPNITFNKTNTTIDNELNTEMLAQNSEEVKTSEENIMSTEEKTEDFLSIVQNLSADLAASDENKEDVKNDDSTETEQSSEIDSSEDTPNELSENSDDKTDLGEEKIETKEEGEEEVNTESADSDEQLSETENSTEEQAEQTESTEEDKQETKEEEPDEKDLKIEALTQENEKLKNALHTMLAERVVDTKIAFGIIKQEDRAEELKEHSKRTVSSLADAIRDLEKLPVSMHSSFTKEAITQTITPKTNAVEGKDGDRVIEESESADHKVKVAPEKKIEDTLVNILLNRKNS